MLFPWIHWEYLYWLMMLLCIGHADYRSSHIYYPSLSTHTFAPPPSPSWGKFYPALVLFMAVSSLGPTYPLMLSSSRTLGLTIILPSPDNYNGNICSNKHWYRPVCQLSEHYLPYLILLSKTFYKKVSQWCLYIFIKIFTDVTFIVLRLLKVFYSHSVVKWWHGVRLFSRLSIPLDSLLDKNYLESLYSKAKYHLRSMMPM